MKRSSPIVVCCQQCVCTRKQENNKVILKVETNSDIGMRIPATYIYAAREMRLHGTASHNSLIRFNREDELCYNQNMFFCQVLSFEGVYSSVPIYRTTYLDGEMRKFTVIRLMTDKGSVADCSAYFSLISKLLPT